MARQASLVLFAAVWFLVCVCGVHAKSCAGYAGSAYSHCMTDDDYSQYARYIERVTVPSYRFASDAAYERFKDIKYGVRVHWGIYSIVDTWGGPEAGHESWPFQTYNMTFRATYENLYKTWNPKNFSAEAWMDFFVKAGFKMFAFTTKHHEGFSMFNTSTTVTNCGDWPNKAVVPCPANHHYSIMETPFGRDVVKELTDAARLRGLLVDLYFSHPDWHDADFRPFGFHPFQTPSSCSLLDTYAPSDQPECQQVAQSLGSDLINASDPTADGLARLVARHRTQLTELLSNYGPIDMVCLDIQLGGAIWPSVRETVELMRKLQPDVMIRERGIANYGDYFTPEDFVPDSPENSDAPWFVIYPLGDPFSFDPNPANYKGASWIVNNLVDAIAKGGNFMVGIGADALGLFHPVAVEQVPSAGNWVAVNDEGIYATRPRDGANMWNETNIRFTRTKDNSTVFAFALTWPGSSLTLATLLGTPKTQVGMLGIADTAFSWQNTAAGLEIAIPDWLQDPAKRPCDFVWTFKIVAATDVVPPARE